LRSSVLTRPPLLGSTTPRLWTRPLVTGPPGPCGCGCALTPATSRGFSAVDFAEQVLGVVLIPWQRWLFIHALELRRNGRFRYRTVLILIARQNGKTSWVEIKNLWKMFVLRVPLVIGTAQNLDISEESWDKAVEIAESIPDLAVEIAHVDKTNGKKALKLKYGSRWKIAAASRKGGRGLSGDDVNLDELREHQSWVSWAAVTKTTMARANAQVYGFSNAGDDLSIVLNSLQAMGRAAALGQEHVDDELGLDADDTLGLFEWSAPEDVKCTCAREENKPHAANCRLRDREAWAMANPSLGYTVTEEALSSALATDPTNVFRTECLCQHVPKLVDDRVIPAEVWRGLVDAESLRGDDLVFAVDTEPNRGHSSIGVYSLRDDGVGHVELIDYRPGTGWVVARLVELKAKHRPMAIALDAKGPAGSLLPDLEAAGITVPEDPDLPRRGDLAVPYASDVAAACGQFLDAIAARAFRHIDQTELNLAVDGAQTRNLSDAQAWARRTATADISPLVAVTLARWAYVTRVDKVQPEEADPEAWWI
jgi:hypothetical protein